MAMIFRMSTLYSHELYPIVSSGTVCGMQKFDQSNPWSGDPDERFSGPVIAVIGAGMAGLTAARLLTERGCRVTVFDKGRRPGGRMSSRWYPDLAFDHGCQYFTAHDRRFQLHVEAWEEAGVVSRWAGRRAACAHGVFSLVEDEVVRYVGVPEMQSVAAHLARGLDVRTECQVVSLDASASQWALKTTGTAPGRFDAVLISVPAPQAAALLPASTSFGDRVRGLEMQACWAIMAAYDRDLELGFDAAHISGNPLVWICRNDRKPGRVGDECWTLHASPDWSRNHLEEDRDEVTGKLLAAFHALAGLRRVQPVFVRAHRWRYASPAHALEDGYLWDPAARIGVCGDWCHSPRVEGAFLSGWMLAEQVLAHLV